MICLLAALDFGAGGNGLDALRGGWSHPEEGFVWSSGFSSTLEVPAPPTPEGVWLELELGVLTHAPVLTGQMVQVDVNGTQIGARRLGGEGVWRLDVPADCCRGAGSLAVALHYPDAASPARLGVSGDQRILAIRLRKLALVQDTGRADLPAPNGRFDMLAEHRFGWNEPTADMLLEGWGAPEAGHVWARGRRSVLRVTVPRGEACTLILDMQPHIALDVPRQRIAIGAGGHLQYYVALKYRTALALHVTPETDSIDVSFDNLDAAAPVTDGDGRAFAFMLLSVRVLRERRHARASGMPISGFEAAHIVSEFESLGNLCELGLLQRRLGQEPQGLLRFAGIMSPQLIEGLVSGFAGLGRPDTLVLGPRDDKLAGYGVADNIYSLSFRTPEAETEADVKRKLARRLPFLVRKFLADAVQARKIFVFYREDRTTRAEAEAVLAALRLWGDAVVLWLTHEQPGVVRLSDGLLCAGLPKNDSDWLEILAAAHALK